jgi:hypothetical protein
MILRRAQPARSSRGVLVGGSIDGSSPWLAAVMVLSGTSPGWCRGILRPGFLGERATPAFSRGALRFLSLRGSIGTG